MEASKTLDRPIAGRLAPRGAKPADGVWGHRRSTAAALRAGASTARAPRRDGFHWRRAGGSRSFMRADYATLDEALGIIAPAAPELANTFSNHAPMAIEAMCALGRGDAVLPWLEHYRKGFVPRPAPQDRITEADWREALGNPRRFADWAAFFARELAEQPWRQVVDRWTARLAPGIVAAALHGVLRTGHVVRALGVEDTPARRHELSDGLAYWASEFQRLPSERQPRAHALPSDAIARVPLFPPAERRDFGSLTGALGQLDAFAPFGATLDAVDPAPNHGAFLSDLTLTFARVYLANAHDWLTTIAFIHTVTGPSALRPLLGLLDAGTQQLALAHAWEASAALYATFATEARLPVVETAPGVDELVERALVCGDEHGIKFTEVCLREHAHRGDPAFLAAADHAVGMLSKA